MELMHPDPRLRISLTLGVLTAAAIPAAALPMLFHYFHIPRAVIRILWYVWAVVLTASIIYIPLLVRRMRYDVDNTRILSEYGVLIRRQRRMTTEAVRHMTVIRGPVERVCGFCFVSFSAAGGRILLAGIPQDLAEEWMHRMADPDRRQTI